MTARWVLLPLVVLPAFGSGCICAHDARSSGLEKTAFGDLSAQKVDLAPYVSLARALLSSGEVAKPLAPSPGRRAFLTVFRKHEGRTVSTGLGATLEASVVAAVRAQPPSSRDGGDGGEGAGRAFRVQIDVIDTVEPMSLDEDDMTSTWGGLGMSGYAVTVDGRELGYVLPSELILDKDFEENGGKGTKLAAAKILKALDARGKLKHEDGQGFRIRTHASVDTASANGALELRRGAVAMIRETSPANLLDAVRLGADYLARSLDTNGRYAFRYRPTDDRVTGEYGMLRHSGSTYALLEAYEELKVPLYLTKSERALTYAESQLKWIDDHGKRDGYLVDSADEEQQKVGGAGLLLIALAKHIELTGSKDHLENARALARFIVHQQYPDGHFRANHDVESEGMAPDGAKLKAELLYYPGEAILGLVRLYRVDADPTWLAAAKKGADYCVHVRDVDVSLESQEHDHWLTYAMNDLYRITPDASYLQHAEKIAHAIQSKQKTGHDAPAADFIGSFYNEAPTTPASTRLEALTADIELERFAKRPEEWLMKPALAVSKFTRAQQFDPDRVFFAKDPDKALGGVRESPFVEDVRIDYVQHAMSGWIHLSRELSDPAYVGWAGPQKETDKP